MTVSGSVLGGTSTPHRHRPGQKIDEHWDKGAKVEWFLCAEPGCNVKVDR